MHDQTNELEPIWNIPVAPTIEVLRPSKYGSVPGLDDDELADPEELERLAAFAMFEPLITIRPGNTSRWARAAQHWMHGLDG